MAKRLRNGEEVYRRCPKRAMRISHNIKKATLNCDQTSKLEKKAIIQQEMFIRELKLKRRLLNSKLEMINEHLKKERDVLLKLLGMKQRCVESDDDLVYESEMELVSEV
jgi:hypothetical protein